MPLNFLCYVVLHNLLKSCDYLSSQSLKVSDDGAL
jgi:hypothetical protein